MSKSDTKAEKVITKDPKKGRTSIWLPRAAGSQSNIDDLYINGGLARIQLAGELVSAELSRSIEGASTVTIKVFDPGQRILNSPMAEQSNVAVIDHLRFVLAAIGYDEDEILTLVFEDEIAWILKQMKGYLKVFRSKYTRDEFIHMMIREANQKKKAGIGYMTREEKVVQPIQTEREARANDKEKDHTKAPGLSRADRGKITVKHEAVSLEELHIIDTVLDTGLSMGAGFKLLVCSIMTITQETHATNENMGAAGVGPFSQEPGTWSPGNKGATNDVAEDAAGFFEVGIPIDKKEPDKGYDELCQAIQNSGFPEAYAQWEDEAKHTVEVYLGGTDIPSNSGESEKTIIKPYSYERRKKESTWACAKRLAEEVNWRRFVLGGYFYYMSEAQLGAARSRARMALDEPGVESIPFEHDTGKPVTELTINVFAKTWALPPGSVVVVDGMGPADDRYLIETTTKDLLYETDIVSVTAKRPMKQLPEPRNETNTVTVGGGAGSGTSAGAEKMIKWAKSVLGTTEGSARQMKWDEFAGVGAGTPWCSVFISYGLVKICGLSRPENPAYSGTWMEGWEDGTQVNPKDIEPGDLIIYDWGDGGKTDHVALYIGNGKRIGGNEGNAVEENEADLGQAVGIVRPNYGG